MRKLRMKGGLRVKWESRPTAPIEALFTPSRLRLPVKTLRFHFSEIKVAAGDRVRAGQELACAPDASNAPLLAPLGGTVSFETGKKNRVEAICLDDLEPREPSRDERPEPPNHFQAETQHLEIRRRFIEGGGWHMIGTFPDVGPADPQTQPSGVVISCVKTEPFLPRGHALLKNNLREFSVGLETLQRMLGGYESIHMVVGPPGDTDLAAQLKEHCRGYAWLQVHELSPTYPHDHPAAILQSLGTRATKEQPYWCIWTEGVLALHRIVVTERPALKRVYALGGPGVRRPCHVYGYPGTPIKELLAGRLADNNGDYCYVKGGIFTGQEVDPETASLDA
ncbi:MAG TPA: hypothetical protein VM492_12675, partial [Sumerlaeia bacterium]|nr:hypothetical protein [Sumerlaeia bacterium]